MPTDMLVYGLCLVGLGTVFLTLGILSRLGIYRSIYAKKGAPVVAPRSFVFVSIPVALVAMLMGVLVLLPVSKETRGDLVVYLLIPLLILTYALAIWRPWWLKPKWLRWLEREHGRMAEVLWKEVREEGYWAWEQRVRTQEQLEQWVEEVRRKHKLIS